MNLENKEIYINNKNVTNEIAYIYESSNIYLIRYLNSSKVYRYKKQNVIIKEKQIIKALSSNIFNYYKEIAGEIGIKIETEDKSTIDILKDQYESLEEINKESILYHYIQGTYSTKQIPNTIIYPFGINQSQKIAVERALSNQVSVIEGPPGTGKTQTILNIIANIVYNNQNVAVVSNNNSAIINVLDKLKANDIDFISALLGKKENKESFINNQTGQHLKEIKNWALEAKEKELLNQSLKELIVELNNKLEFKNKLSLINKELMDYEVEKHYYDNHFINKEKIKIDLRKIKSNELIKFITEYEYKYEYNTLVNKILTLFKYGKQYLDLYNMPKEDVINTLQSHFYSTKIDELNTEKEILEKQLEKFNFDDKLKDLSNKSLVLFKDKLSSIYNKEKRTIYTYNDLRHNSTSFIKEYPVILSTTYSLKNSLSQDFMYDYLIIDESSQVDLVTGALAFSCARNVVIVGDQKQLPNVITLEDKIRINKTGQKYSIEDKYRLIIDDKPNSLLNSSLLVWTDIPNTLLKEHYRCEPRIINFCNEMFYNNELVIMTEKEENPSLSLHITAEGNHARDHHNKRQIDVIKQDILPELKQKGLNDIGIISPYRDQVEEIKRQLGEEIEIDTVHKFQGREKDAIIISSVDNKISEFVDDPNLLNVAVSRAKKYLAIVISNNEENWVTNFGYLKRYIEYNNLEIKYSDISSVFDLLYKNKEKEKIEYIKKHKIENSSIAESLLLDEINKILSIGDYQNVGCAIHYSLSNLVNDYTNLTVEEIQYIRNGSHLDFLLFNRIDKKPICAIELNGTSFHRKGSKQEKRDIMKRNILDKIGFPLLTIWTDESDYNNEIIEFISKYTNQ